MLHNVCRHTPELFTSPLVDLYTKQEEKRANGFLIGLYYWSARKTTCSIVNSGVPVYVQWSWRVWDWWGGLTQMIFIDSLTGLYALLIHSRKKAEDMALLNSFHSSQTPRNIKSKWNRKQWQHWKAYVVICKETKHLKQWQNLRAYLGINNKLSLIGTFVFWW